MPGVPEMVECVGGPFHRELRVVDAGSITLTIPLPPEWWTDPKRPEWVGYHRLGSELRFVVREYSREACHKALVAWRPPC